jgi:ABC-type Zn2+ transport system substrate-binding protein/surface adhesin
MVRKSKRKTKRELEDLEIVKLQIENEEAQRRHEEAQRRHEEAMAEAQRRHEEAQRRHEEAMAEAQHRHEIEVEKIRAGWYTKRNTKLVSRKKSGESAKSETLGPLEVFRVFWGRRKLVRNISLPNYTDIAEDSPPSYSGS